MNKMIAVVFDNEKSSYEALKEMKDLHKEGSLTLYSTAVLAKDSEGKVTIKEAEEKGPIGTAIGMATGGMIGLLIGPAGAAAGAVAGAAAGGALFGASLGGLTGLFFDIDAAGVDATFVDEVSNALTVDKYALLAEVDEMWITPLDTRMTELDGLVFRRLRSEVIDDQLTREAEAFDREMAALKAELAEASDDAKSKISKQIKLTREKLELINKNAKEKLDKTVAEGKAKVEALEQQIQGVSDKRKAKMEERKKELKAEYAARAKKLEQAWQLTKDALA